MEGRQPFGTPVIPITPIPPAGSIDAQTLKAITDPIQNTTTVQQPSGIIFPVGPSPVNVPVPTTDPVQNSGSAVIPASTPLQGGQLMSWVKANPIPAAGIAALGIYLLYKYMK